MTPTTLPFINDFFNHNIWIYIVLFVLYEVLYKLIIIDKIKSRVQRKIIKEQNEIVEATKLFYLEKLEEYKTINNERIENLKAIHSNESETLKSSLNKLLTLQIHHRNEEREALINFVASCNQWIFKLSKINFDRYNLKNFQELKIKIADIKDEYFLGIYAERIKILLFITNEGVNAMTNTLFESIQKYKSDIEFILIELFDLLDTQFSSGYEVTDIDEKGEYIIIRYSIDNADKIKKLSIDFENFNSTSFANCMRKIEDFARIAKTYLISEEFKS